jgi:hypothetical protein
MAVNRLDLSPELREAIERARPTVDADVAAHRRRRHIEREPLPSEVRSAVERVLADGSYARAVDAVAAEEPDLADG